MYNRFHAECARSTSALYDKLHDLECAKLDSVPANIYIIQCIDYDEGSCARYTTLNGKFSSHSEARQSLARIREQDYEYGSLRAYRIVVEGSDYSYSQPTDRLEY